MRRILALLAATALLASCVNWTLPGQRGGQEDQPTVRGVLGGFCPPAQATKGYC